MSALGGLPRPRRTQPKGPRNTACQGRGADEVWVGTGALIHDPSRKPEMEKILNGLYRRSNSLSFEFPS